MRNKYFLLILFSVVSIFSCEEEKIDIDNYGSISGSIVDGDDYAPLQGVQVTTNPPSIAVLTDEDGTFKIDRIKEGDVVVSARKKDYLSGNIAIAVYEEENTEVRFFLLKDENNVGNIVIYDPVPGNGAVNQPKDITLAWKVDQSKTDILLTYTVFLFESNSTNQEIVGQNLTTTEVIVANLNTETTYYWYVLAKYEGRNVANSPTWTFRTSD